jgi:hypothetical protein
LPQPLFFSGGKQKHREASEGGMSHAAVLAEVLDGALRRRTETVAQTRKAARDVATDRAVGAPWSKPNTQLAREIESDGQRQALFKPVIALADALHESLLSPDAVLDAGLVRRLLVLRPGVDYVPVLRALRFASPADSDARLRELLATEPEASFEPAMKAAAVQVIRSAPHEKNEAFAFAEKLLKRLVDDGSHRAPVRLASVHIAVKTMRDVLTGFVLLARRGHGHLQTHLVAAARAEAEAASTRFLDAAYDCIQQVADGVQARIAAAQAKATAEIARVRQLREQVLRPQDAASLSKAVAEIEAGAAAARLQVEVTEERRTRAFGNDVSRSEAREAEVHRAMLDIARSVDAEWHRVATEAAKVWESAAERAFDMDLDSEDRRARKRLRFLNTETAGHEVVGAADNGRALQKDVKRQRGAAQHQEDETKQQNDEARRQKKLKATAARKVDKMWKNALKN